MKWVLLVMAMGPSHVRGSSRLPMKPTTFTSAQRSQSSEDYVAERQILFHHKFLYTLSRRFLWIMGIYCIISLGASEI
jgi:hypothetical protein